MLLSVSCDIFLRRRVIHSDATEDMKYSSDADCCIFVKLFNAYCELMLGRTKESMTKSNESGIDKNSMSISSIDNIDFLLVLCISSSDVVSS